MKTALIFVSEHHGNTGKLAAAIGERHEITLIDGNREECPELAAYDCIGFASGIAYGKLYPKILDMMRRNLPDGKKVFFLYTCGSKRPHYTKEAVTIAREKNCTVLGEYGCLGYDTFGPFKLIGGIAKGHPTDDEITGAVGFYDSINAQAEDSVKG